MSGRKLIEWPVMISETTLRDYLPLKDALSKLPKRNPKGDPKGKALARAKSKPRPSKASLPQRRRQVWMTFGVPPMGVPAKADQDQKKLFSIAGFIAGMVIDGALDND